MPPTPPGACFPFSIDRQQPDRTVPCSCEFAEACHRQQPTQGETLIRGNREGYSPFSWKLGFDHTVYAIGTEIANRSVNKPPSSSPVSTILRFYWSNTYYTSRSSPVSLVHAHVPNGNESVGWKRKASNYWYTVDRIIVELGRRPVPVRAMQMMRIPTPFPVSEIKKNFQPRIIDDSASPLEGKQLSAKAYSSGPPFLYLPVETCWNFRWQWRTQKFVTARLRYTGRRRNNSHMLSRTQLRRGERHFVSMKAVTIATFAPCAGCSTQGRAHRPVPRTKVEVQSQGGSISNALRGFAPGWTNFAVTFSRVHGRGPRVRVARFNDGNNCTGHLAPCCRITLPS